MMSQSGNKTSSPDAITEAATALNLMALQKLHLLAEEADQFFISIAERNGWSSNTAGLGMNTARKKRNMVALQGMALVLNDPAFQLFAEYVVEACIFGLIQQSAAGDWLDEE
uniref:Uncharacterized protein n=1 Tax=Polytomella parva TaxID=51329 RepID=A0A7S0UW55_9CHLO|mmetsp:Transcript_20286/g.36463  ORF Transcript_20286/g.36463 Transcript_20286/m.36463 type:complete len:112 (+) Transcript_20286:90-425(+)